MFRTLLLASLLVLSGCSGGDDLAPPDDAAANDAEASTVCGPYPDTMSCADVCDGHIYGPSCVKGEWECVYRDKTKCGQGKDAGDDVPCTTEPPGITCTDPCSGQPYELTCKAGSWGCWNAVPDGGCVKPEAGHDAGTFKCGEELCSIATQFCRQPAPPQTCPKTDAGPCPPGCPGCEPLLPSCRAIPGECANSVTCACIVKAVCGSAMNGICQPTQGGLTAGCSGM